MLVHWGGTPVDLNRVSRVREVCYQRFGFRPMVVEDCAHAFGAECAPRNSSAQDFGAILGATLGATLGAIL